MAAAKANGGLAYLRWPAAGGSESSLSAGGSAARRPWKPRLEEMAIQWESEMKMTSEIINVGEVAANGGCGGVAKMSASRAGNQPYHLNVAGVCGGNMYQYSESNNGNENGVAYQYLFNVNINNQTSAWQYIQRRWKREMKKKSNRNESNQYQWRRISQCQLAAKGAAARNGYKAIFNGGCLANGWRKWERRSENKANEIIMAINGVIMK